MLQLLDLGVEAVASAFNGSNVHCSAGLCRHLPQLVLLHPSSARRVTWPLCVLPADTEKRTAFALLRQRFPTPDKSEEGLPPCSLGEELEGQTKALRVSPDEVKMWYVEKEIKAHMDAADKQDNRYAKRVVSALKGMGGVARISKCARWAVGRVGAGGEKGGLGGQIR